MKEHRTTEEEMEGPISFLRIKEQETHLIIHEHDDDDGDGNNILKVHLHLSSHLCE